MSERTLVVAPNWVGDAVLAQPLLARLQAQAPQRAIDVLAPAWTLPLFERMPEVARRLPAPFDHGRLAWPALRALARELRGQYAHAVVLPNSLKSALLPWLAKIPRRTGYRGEWRYGLLNDMHTLDATALPLMVQRFAALAGPLGNELLQPVLRIDPLARAAALDALALDARQPSVALCPGAEYGPAKRWPARHFASVARHYRERGFAVWLLGSPKDAPVTGEINALAGGGCVDLAGRTSLGQAVDLLSLATHVVSNDSGLMHIAAALDRPMVAIYGSSSPRFTPPLSPQSRVVSLTLACSPCFARTCPLGHLRCLNELAPEKVLQALPPI